MGAAESADPIGPLSRDGRPPRTFVHVGPSFPSEIREFARLKRRLELVWERIGLAAEVTAATCQRELSLLDPSLEAYPLESLNMVGTLQQGKSTYALVRTPDKDVYQVTTGNYLGQNFGVILGINENEIRLKELVQDGSGDWAERTGTLQLIQADTKTGAKK